MTLSCAIRSTLCCPAIKYKNYVLSSTAIQVGVMINSSSQALVDDNNITRNGVVGVYLSSGQKIASSHVVCFAEYKNPGKLLPLVFCVLQCII